MKLRVILIAIVASAILAIDLASPAFVQADCDQQTAANASTCLCSTTGAASTTFCQDSTSSTGTNPISGANGLIIKGANVISVVAGIAAVIMLLIGSMQYITSGGDSGKTSGAKNTIMYALIGLVVIVVAQTIIRFVLAVVK